MSRSFAPEIQFKRKFPRRQFSRAAGFLFNGDYFVGQCVEIGEGGIALFLPKEFPTGRQGVVSFQIPDGSFICVRIEIRNHQVEEGTGKTITGCAFQNLTFDHKREIRTYVSARSELEPVGITQTKREGF